MLKVAITGGIGSGKSFVCRKFNELGIPIFYTDDEAKHCYKLPEVQTKVKALFGDNIYAEDGLIDRKKLAGIIFNDKSQLDAVYEIVLPVLRERFDKWSEEQTSPYVVCESAILFETKGEDNFDVVITVTCPIETRIERAMLRGGINKPDLIARIENQMSEEEKVQQSDMAIINNGVRNVDEQVKWVHKTLLTITSNLTV
jgi:dephospho-CoA kinase